MTGSLTEQIHGDAHPELDVLCAELGQQVTLHA
ncbi:hypothetical protein HNQ08_004318 [Deinococcus humi]|uniref:Uncharacterized protein n=1 Tax=Deinococcus humi TaxID=662880 RepID=A0A7W8JXT0_9DEIO|nr:hypothetical protein [Deinococcus humi]